MVKEFKPTTNKIADKLSKVDNSFTVSMYDNGFLFEISGKDITDDWSSVKLICENMSQLSDLIQEAATMTRD
jgi:hypothetical protein